MKFTAILHKYKHNDPTVFPAWKVLRMATIEAAESMGIAEQVGSLRPGKKADVILMDLHSPAMSPVLSGPVRNIVPNIVYSASGSEVETVIIDGRVVVENYVLQTVDEVQEIAAANKAAERICQRLRDTGWERELPLAQWTKEGLY